TLVDIRIGDAEQKEVPYLVRPVPAIKTVRRINPTMFDPGELPDGGFRATFDITPQAEHCEVELSLSGNDAVYLHRTKIETGEKLKDLQLVSEGAIVYQIAGQTSSARADNRVVRYPPSIARYVRVTLLPDPQLKGRPTRIDGAVFYCTEPPMVQPEDRV